MLNCHCDHPADRHAPLQDFGASMCLVADCECDGMKEQVAAAGVRRAIRMAPTAEQVYRTVLEVLSNPYPRTIDDQARNVAAALIGNFKIEGY